MLPRAHVFGFFMTWAFGELNGCLFYRVSVIDAEARTGVFVLQDMYAPSVCKVDLLFGLIKTSGGLG